MLPACRKERQLADTQKFTPDSLVADVIAAPEFGEYGRFLFVPENLTDGLQLRDYAANFVVNDADLAAQTLNDLLDLRREGRLTFHEIYSDEEKAADPEKADTVLLFFHGDKDAPFAELNAGGAFQFVSLLQESLPPAVELARRGINAFALHYRVTAGRAPKGGIDPGFERSYYDLSRALEYIFDHAKELGVSTEDYSVWGFSAGAQMTGAVSSNGTAAYDAKALPRPAAQILAYIDYAKPTGAEPPTFAVMGEKDQILDWHGMQRRIDELSELGIDTEFLRYPEMGHGFGMGTGTDADGWFEEAVRFWKNHSSRTAG